MTDKKCFIIMPVTTPPELVSVYKDDSQHFLHVMEHLFIPAIKKAGFEPIRPITEGSDIIHGHIISNLESSDLVLCDMSTNNPNVFFELGIRTALNKPICLVKDPFVEKVPFDIVPINYHVYSPDLSTWKVENEVDKLAKHITDSFSRNDSCNSLWQYFGTKTQPKEDTAIENISKETSGLINPIRFKKLEGIVVAVRYGLIKRCPQCEKILQKGQCPIHEKVRGIYDLYLEAILYNGILVNNLTIKRPVLEKYFDTSIDTCIAIAANNLDPDLILEMFSKQMIGNRFVLKGIHLPYSFDVKSMEIDERYSHESALKLYEKWESDKKR